MSVKLQKKKGGYRIVGSGGGGKSGDSARTPVETPDSLHNNSYASVLDAIGNGELYGPAHPDQPLRDIYLDGTPIQNEDGSLNFERVEADYRVGTVDQEHISGFPASSSVFDVGQEITQSISWTQLITDSDLSALRVSVYVPQLIKTIDSGDNAGDRVGYSVSYAIDLSTDNGSFVNVLEATIDGKTVNGYTRTHRIELSTGSQWMVRVRRTSAEADSTTISDAIYVQSYAQVIDGKFRFPMTALVGLKIDAEQFSSIPTRAFHWKGRIVRVPSNYDTIERTYTGVWDGTFKLSWTDNPAWIYYDMVTNNLYGLGDYINASNIDRYALYQISAYCDQMVDDGQGGLEPRFTCNVYIQSAEDALQVLNDLSSIFRGMTYWGSGEIVPVSDSPSDPIYTYTNANVINGLFEYAGADISTRKTVALVSWNDPSDFYNSKVEAVEDADGIARYGVRKTEVKAFGCTSRAQAQRVGLYILYTSRMETGSASFSVGLDGVIPQPGSIVKVADRNRAGRSIGGRIRSATADYVIVDRDHPAKIGDTLTVNLPDGTAETRTVSDIDDRKITVNSSFSTAPTSQSAWAIDADDLVTQLVRVVSVKEESDITYSITSVFHHPDKFEAIDTGVRLDPLPVSVVPPRTQSAPTNIVIEQHYSFHQGTTRHWAEISWDAPEYAVSYDVQWRRDNGDWVIMPRMGTRLAEISDIFAGAYTVRIRAINSLDVPSLWAYSESTLLDGQAGAPATLTSLTTKSDVMAITTSWVYPDTPNIISKVELRASLNNQFSDSNLVTEKSYPETEHTLYGLGYGVEMWFWARLVDKNGLPGDWYPSEESAGVKGSSSSDANDLLDYLEGQIAEGQLSQDLLEELDAMGAAVEETTKTVDDLNGALSASWQVKTQVREDGRVVQAGVAIGASIDEDGKARSEALFMADTVAFLTKLDGKLHSPFIFDVANDTAILNSAIIGNATIGFAKIQDDLQSVNWDWNGGSYVGWKINKAGDVYFDDGTFKGAFYAKSGELENVTIHENCTIEGTLRASQIYGNINGTTYATNNEVSWTNNSAKTVMTISINENEGADSTFHLSPPYTTTTVQKYRLRSSWGATTSYVSLPTITSMAISAGRKGKIYVEVSSGLSSGQTYTMIANSGWLLTISPDTNVITVS